MNAKAFLKALDNLSEEKKISKETIYEAMELALTTAYKKNFKSKDNVRVDFNKENGKIKVFSVTTVVDEVVDEETEISLADAKKVVKKIKLGETIEEEVTPKDFDRVAAATAKQVIIQKIKEAEKESILEEYGDIEGEIVVGSVSMEDAENYLIDLGRVIALLPKGELITGEKIVMGSSIKAYVTKVNGSGKSISIILSRKHFNFVKRLFEIEIPEIKQGIILIHKVARSESIRTKISLSSTNSNVDPIGSCIGENGSRIGNIVKELNGEKVDLVLYDKDPKIYIENALSPAKGVNVIITDEVKCECFAIVDNDNLSLAIGKKGSNVVLASKLTGYRIDVKTKEQLSETGINIK